LDDGADSGRIIENKDEVVHMRNPFYLSIYIFAFLYFSYHCLLDMLYEVMAYSGVKEQKRDALAKHSISSCPKCEDNILR
jgi:hypothetical protein